MQASRPIVVFAISLVLAFALAPWRTTASAGRYYGDWVDTNPAPGIKDNSELLRVTANRILGSDGRTRYREIESYLLSQIDRTAVAVGQRFPHASMPSGAWQTVDVGTWTTGHWVGLLWLAYRETGEQKYLDWANTWAQQIYDRRRYDTGTHDHGFLFGLSQIKGLPFQKDDKLRAKFREGALIAADTYTKKLNPLSGMISWHGSYEDKKNKDSDESVIDSMMNVPLMWWATEQTGDQRFVQVGLSQTEAMRKQAIRQDFSTCHGVVFEPKTGRIVGQKTFQGYADGSCWARGHAWAIYGFGVVYYKTGQEVYLQTARGVADYFLRRLPADRVPYWDFDCPDIPNTYRDTSAAAIVASGLINLARFEPDRDRAVTYLEAAVAILDALSAPAYLTNGPPQMGFLRHGCQNYPTFKRTFDPILVDASLIYGDYYYLDAIVKLLTL